MNLMANMEKAFDVFNNCTAKICDVSQGDGYLEEDVSFSEVGVCEGDFQPYNPYSNTVNEREYGKYKDVTARFFCVDPNGFLQVGRAAVTGDATYDILGIEPWEFGKVAFLKERVI